MKKLFLFSALAVVGMSAAADNWHAEEVLSLPGSNYSYAEGRHYLAYDNIQKESYTWSFAIINGSDITYYVLDGNLHEIEQFTLKGVYGSNITIQTIEFTGIDISNLLVSKGVFTDDAKWCVTLTDRDSHKTNVYNEDGKFIGELPGGDKVSNYYAQLIPGSLFDGSSAIFLCITENQNTGACKFYRFTGSSGVAKVVESKAVNAYPNPVHRGETLTVSLPQVADENTTVSVMDMNGILVYNSKVAAGTESVAIPTDNLPLGILLYSISSPEGKPLTGKICVE